MFPRRTRPYHTINAGAMADIAFLLLIFFLVTTTMHAEKGLTLCLSPPTDPQQSPSAIEKNERNILRITLDDQDQVLVKGKPLTDITQLKTTVKQFITNNGADPHLSDAPQKALVALQTDRATHYSRYISVLDQIQGAYYEAYGERVGLTPAEFRKLNKRNIHQKKLYETARKDFPMNIAIAEPNNRALHANQ